MIEHLLCCTPDALAITRSAGTAEVRFGDVQIG